MEEGVADGLAVAAEQIGKCHRLAIERWGCEVFG
jgi:hypothetical protein